MKKLILVTLLAIGSLSVQAGGYGNYHGGGYRGWHSHSSVSFSFGFPGFYAPYAYSSWSYPSYGYSYYPRYSYYNYSPDYSYASDYSAPVYSRPNYAVGGTLLGALTGGLIGNSINHQGWEGAGIGALAGLFLGSVAEQNARARAQAYSYSAAPQVIPSQPNHIGDVPTVNNAPTAPAAPRVSGNNSTYQPASGNMSGANVLFGR